MKVVVVGCGVIGLTSAIRLQEAGYAVEIWAKDLPPHTTSNVAAAIWYPYKIAPADKVAEWCKLSYEVFVELTELPQAGVSMRTGLELFANPISQPTWREFVQNYRPVAPHELPSGYLDGYFFDAPMIQTRIFMAYLQNRFVEGGGQISQREVQSLEAVFEEAQTPIVVNCSGLGSRTLLNDTGLYPIRGQIVRVAAFGTDNFVSAENQSGTASYVIPRYDDCILGGTAQVDDWTLEPDPATAELIQQKCAELLPQAANVRVLEHLVGLRPGRHEVRLEAEAHPNGNLLVHNYGHGGAGVTVSWGCAAQVVGLVAQAGPA